MSRDAVLHAGAPTEDPAEGSAEGRTEGSTEGPAVGHADGSADGRAQGRAEGSADVSVDGKPGRHPEPLWTLVDRGSFVVGTCDACGYTSPARRARYSAESDMLAHEILCDALRDEEY